MIIFSDKLILGIIIPAASVISVFITPEIIILQKHFSVNVNSIELIMSYYLTGYLIGQTLFAYISKKIGHKKSIHYGIIFALLSMLIQIKAFNLSSFNLFLTGRFLTAVGLSSGMVCGFAYLKNHFTEKEEKNFLSIITVVFPFSIYFSIFLSGNFVKYLNINISLWTNIFYILIILILSLFIKHNNINHKFISQEKIKINIQTSFKIIIYSLCLSISTIFAYCYALYAPIFLIKDYNLSPNQFSNYNFINLVAILLGSYIFTKIANKISTYKLILFSMILLFIGAISYFLTIKVPLPYSFIFFIFISFFLNILCGIIYPAATYKCLQIGQCKLTSSAIMNTFKIGMPTIAIFLIGNYNTNPLINLSLTISIFSFLFIGLLLILFLKNYSNKKTMKLTKCI